MDVVAGYVWAGYPVEHVAREYSIAPVQVLVSSWYVGTYGSRLWKRRWGKWAKEAFPMLWDRERQAECPSPPSAL